MRRVAAMGRPAVRGGRGPGGLRGGRSAELEPGPGNRPSLSSLAGGLGMNRAIRGGLSQGQREVVLLPEEYTGANIFYRVADLTYDAQFYFLMADLQARGATPEEWACGFPAVSPRPAAHVAAGGLEDALDQQSRHRVVDRSRSSGP